MELWDEMMRPLKPDFDRLEPAAGLRSAVNVIRWTMDHFRPPLQEGGARNLVVDSLERFESALGRGENAVSRNPEIEERIEAVLDESYEPGVSNLVMACVQSFSRGAELEGKSLCNVFGSCYNAVLEQEFSGPFIDIADEEANPRCRETIEFQQDLLRQAR